MNGGGLYDQWLSPFSVGVVHKNLGVGAVCPRILFLAVRIDFTGRSHRSRSGLGQPIQVEVGGGFFQLL